MGLNPVALSISLVAIYGCALRSRSIREAALSREGALCFCAGDIAGTALLAVLLVGKLAPAEYLDCMEHPRGGGARTRQLWNAC